MIDSDSEICYSLTDIQKREDSRAEMYLEASFLLRRIPDRENADNRTVAVNLHFTY